MADREHVVGLYERHVNRATARLARAANLPIEVRSEGSRVWDDAGREYLDCGGYGVFLLGHRHPRVVAALTEQLGRHPLATRTLLSGEVARASARLAATTPPGLDYVHFASSGAEAVETAIKLARAAGRRRLIGMQGGFHGKTLGALSITDRPAYQRPFRPLLPDTTTVPYGDIAALEAELGGGGKASVVVEPVQGEGGVRIPPEGFLGQVAESCRRAGAFLIVDEIQTGLGRLGTWWGCDREGVVPDVLLAGKSLGGGCMPVSAVVATAEAFSPFNRNPRLHTSTFSGAPLSMAAVVATLDVLASDRLVERAAALGERLVSEVQRVVAVAGSAAVREVRGRGLLLGVELAHPAAAAALVAGLLEHGVIVTSTLTADTVVRLSPPAILDEDDIDWLLSALEGAVGRL